MVKDAFLRFLGFDFILEAAYASYLLLSDLLKVRLGILSCGCFPGNF